MAKGLEDRALKAMYLIYLHATIVTVSASFLYSTTAYLGLETGSVISS